MLTKHRRLWLGFGFFNGVSSALTLVLQAQSSRGNSRTPTCSRRERLRQIVIKAFNFARTSPAIAAGAALPA
jgi:hypothetical protein